MASVQVVNATLPTLPQGWAGEKDFKTVGALSGATQRNVEPVGPHFLAHARRVRYVSLSYSFTWTELTPL
jgi:DnaJ family protein C protein 2